MEELIPVKVATYSFGSTVFKKSVYKIDTGYLIITPKFIDNCIDNYVEVLTSTEYLELVDSHNC